MKTILLLSIHFFMAMSLNAQAYQPMAREGAHWIVGNQTLSPPWLAEKYSLTIRGDSLVNGKNYKKVYQEYFEFNAERKTHTNKIIYSNFYALMRDDTLERKVYAITGEDLQRHCPTNMEHLLFDFSVKEGDTLNWCVLDRRRLSQVCLADSIRMLKHRFADWPVKAIYTRLGVSAYSDPTSLVIVRPVPIFEGFGSDLFSPFLSGNVLINYCVGSDAACGLVVATRQATRPLLKVFPNPTTDVLVIEEERGHESGLNNAVLEIFDATGRVLKRQSLQYHQNKIEVQDLHKGFYLLRLSKGHASFYQTYFVKI